MNRTKKIISKIERTYMFNLNRSLNPIKLNMYPPLIEVELAGIERLRYWMKTIPNPSNQKEEAIMDLIKKRIKDIDGDSAIIRPRIKSN